MHPIPCPFETTPEDALLITKWKLRLVVVYGAVLLVLLAFSMSQPKESVEDTANVPATLLFPRLQQPSTWSIKESAICRDRRTR